MEVLCQNPFNLEDGGRFYTGAGSAVPGHRMHDLKSEVSDFVLQEGYPCVGAQAAVNGGTFAIGDLCTMEGGDTAKNLAYGLMEYLIAMSDRPSDFLSYIAVFPESEFKGEIAFENALWDLLDRLHAEDRKHFGWNPAYSKDPADRNFSFCFGGTGFFIVGMHPQSSRKARRFKYPALAFNFQSQFDTLRAKGRFGILRNAIRERELRFQGSINPMLADQGEGLQAPQYSGRETGREWKCPFMDNH